MRRNLLVLVVRKNALLFALTIFFAACVEKTSSDTDKIYKDWNKKVIGQLSFYYPKDWTYKQKDFAPGKIYGINPPFAADLEHYFAFQITQMPTGGRPFDEFEIYVFNFYSKRTDQHIQMISKEKIKFKNLEAYLIQIEFHDNKNELTNYISLYVINGVKKYYMVSVTRDIPGNGFKIDDILTLILRSLEIAI